MDDVKIEAQFLNKQITRCNNIYSMILGTLGCRLEADADPSSGSGPAQLLPPPSSLVSLFSAFLQMKLSAESILAQSLFFLLSVNIFLLISISDENFRASSAIQMRGKKKKNFLSLLQTTRLAVSTSSLGAVVPLFYRYSSEPFSYPEDTDVIQAVRNTCT